MAALTPQARLSAILDDMDEVVKKKALKTVQTLQDSLKKDLSISLETKITSKAGAHNN